MAFPDVGIGTWNCSAPRSATSRKPSKRTESVALGRMMLPLHLGRLRQPLFASQYLYPPSRVLDEQRMKRILRRMRTADAELRATSDNSLPGYAGRLARSVERRTREQAREMLHERETYFSEQVDTIKDFRSQIHIEGGTETTYYTDADEIVHRFRRMYVYIQDLLNAFDSGEFKSRKTKGEL
ncbi:hypothetical protein BDZ89DRAFT_1055389 [Hymenopellis radicata]|nr:hypothetical protein BDZ89DRAFT_1055389 [Hymenopellis radicata]